MNISLVTLTCYNRYELLKIQVDLINNQICKNIFEWVIIDMSNLIKNIDDIQKKFKNIRLINNIDINNKNIIELANEYTNGDKIILINDDDYYFPTYIDECINKLKYKDSVYYKYVYIYDFVLSKFYKIETNLTICSFNKNKIINLENGIEILPENLIIKFGHNNNNKFKRDLLILSSFINIPNIHELYNDSLDIFISKKYLDLYSKNLNDTSYIDYDIIYLTNLTSIVWDPTDTKLGGSEQAIVNLSLNFNKLNKKVCVYGNFEKNIIYNNVEYVNCNKFPFNRKIKNLILWRRHGLILLMKYDIKADNIILDFHDNFSYTIMDLDSNELNNALKKINKIVFKSEYHKKCFIEFLKDKNIENIFNNNYIVIPNGIRIENFSKNDNITRIPYRFCYCSSYDRGLGDILMKIWPHIYNNYSTAELHVYYGMDYIFDEEFKKNMRILLNQPGVIEHGRQPMETIIKEKYLSTFHLYLNNSIGEIDCISIKESLITGCIPIISNFGVFAERDGIHLDWNPNDKQLCENAINTILLYMNNNELLEKTRNNLIKSSTIIDWLYVANQWLQFI
jgi:hypothetical protein